MTKSILLTVEPVMELCCCKKTRAYEIIQEVLEFRRATDKKLLTIYDLAAYYGWPIMYVFMALYITKEDIIRYFVNEAAKQSIILQSKYGVIEIPFPEQGS